MKNFFLFSSLILLILSSCTLPAAEQAPAAAPTTSGQLETMVAATFAALTPTAAPATETATPLPPSPTLVLPTASVTPTFSTPVLLVSADTNCRSGPGQSYPVLVVLKEKTQVEVTGRYQNNSYWIVKMPNGSGECWMWGEFATPSGSVASMPEMTPPPTSTPAPPAPPRGLSYSFTCSFSDVTVNLTWTDVAIDEQGYKIFRNGEQVVDLPAQSVGYTDVAVASSGSAFTYNVLAYNAAGTGEASISFSCP